MFVAEVHATLIFHVSRDSRHTSMGNAFVTSVKFFDATSNIYPANYYLILDIMCNVCVTLFNKINLIIRRNGPNNFLNKKY